MSEPGSHFPNLLEVLPDEGDVTRATLELLWRAAPEQVDEFDKVLATGVQARLLKGQSPTLGVMYNTLQIPEEVLIQIWILAHAAWQDFLNFQKRKDGESLDEGKGFIDQAVDAAKMIGLGEQPEWPGWMPKFREAKEGVEARAVREMWAMACAWALMHEVKHAKLFDDPERPDDPIREEMICDTYASEILFEKIAVYAQVTGEDEVKVRDKRAIASLVGLYYVAKLSKEGVSSDTHPPLKDRIGLLFAKIDTQPLNHFWDFATALICEIKPQIASMEVKGSNLSSRDIAYTALEYAFGK